MHWIIDMIKALIKKLFKPKPKPPTLPAPSDLVIGDAANDKVFLQFKDNSLDEERFELQRHIIDAEGDEHLDQVHDVPAQPGTRYISYIDTTTSPGMHYQYQVRAIKGELGAGGIHSDWSNSTTVVTPND